MRKNILFLCFTLTFFNVFAQTKQDTSKHLSFKGVPIDGDLKTYVSKMQAVGFSLTQTNTEFAFLTGDFASYKNCTVEVSTLTQKDLVNKIAVTFPDCSDWATLLSNYTNLKNLLIEKYGKPSSNTEEFQSYTPRDDGSKFQKVKYESCTYFTTFLLDKGKIHLSIEQESHIRCFVKLIYTDKINDQIIKKAAIDDL